MGPEDIVALLARDRGDVTITGVCRTYRAAPAPPIVQLVQVAGPLLRVEEPPGQVDTILGDDFVWHRWPDSGRVVRKARSTYESNPYTQPQILMQEPHEHWRQLIEKDPVSVLASVRPAELHTRSAIAMKLPSNLGRELSVVVDAATGVWLEARFGPDPWLDWMRIEFDVVSDPAWFADPND